MSLEISKRISMINSMCTKILSGTDKNRQEKLRSLFQFGVLSIMRHEIYDHEKKSIGMDV